MDVTLSERTSCVSDFQIKPSNRVPSSAKLSKLRGLMITKNISAYIIPNSDDHQVSNNVTKLVMLKHYKLYCCMIHYYFPVCIGYTNIDEQSKYNLLFIINPYGFILIILLKALWKIISWFLHHMKNIPIKKVVVKNFTKLCVTVVLLLSKWLVYSVQKVLERLNMF